MVLKGHVKHVLSLDWSPNGHNLVTGSEDHTLRIWDIRKAESIYTVPAHKNIVSQVKYFKAGDAFQSDSSAHASYTFSEDRMDTEKDDDDADQLDVGLDGSADLEPTENAVPNSLSNRRTRRQVLNGSFLVSSSYDGTCKIWTDGDFKPLKSLTGLEGKITCSDVSGGTVFTRIEYKH
jgi:U4/U6 small nuclear ribonucleoprotein PRP4